MNIIKTKNKNVALLIIFSFLVLLFVSLIYFVFLKKPGGENIYFTRTYKKIKIDFSTLESPLLKDLTPYNPPPLPEKKLGDKNPFLYIPSSPEESSSNK